MPRKKFIKMNEVTYIEEFHDKNEVLKMTYSPLGKTGLRVSKMSLGGGPIGGLYEDLEEKEAICMIQKAIKNGINYIDTAPWYGQGRSEYIIGKALKSIPRGAYYIATKVGRYETNFDGMFDFSAEKTRNSMEQSLKLLGLPYVDIIQIHDIEYAEDLNQIIEETLPNVQKLVDEGKARFIGITGYFLQVLKEVTEKSSIKIDCILSYSRDTLIDNELKNYVPYFQEKEIGLINAGIFGMGLFTLNGPQHWHPANEELKLICRNAAQFCKEKGVDIAELAIYDSLMTGGVSTILVGSGNLEILRKNWKTFTTPLSLKHMELIELIKTRFFKSLICKNWEEEAKKIILEIKKSKEK